MTSRFSDEERYWHGQIIGPIAKIRDEPQPDGKGYVRVAYGRDGKELARGTLEDILAAIAEREQKQAEAIPGVSGKDRAWTATGKTQWGKRVAKFATTQRKAAYILLCIRSAKTQAQLDEWFAEVENERFKADTEIGEAYYAFLTARLEHALVRQDQALVELRLKKAGDRLKDAQEHLRDIMDEILNETTGLYSLGDQHEGRLPTG